MIECLNSPLIILLRNNDELMLKNEIYFSLFMNLKVLYKY